MNGKCFSVLCYYYYYTSSSLQSSLHFLMISFLASHFRLESIAIIIFIALSICLPAVVGFHHTLLLPIFFLSNYKFLFGTHACKMIHNWMAREKKPHRSDANNIIKGDRKWKWKISVLRSVQEEQQQSTN